MKRVISGLLVVLCVVLLPLTCVGETADFLFDVVVANRLSSILSKFPGYSIQYYAVFGDNQELMQTDYRFNEGQIVVDDSSGEIYVGMIYNDAENYMAYYPETNDMTVGVNATGKKYQDGNFNALDYNTVYEGFIGIEEDEETKIIATEMIVTDEDALSGLLESGSKAIVKYVINTDSLLLQRIETYKKETNGALTLVEKDIYTFGTPSQDILNYLEVFHRYQDTATEDKNLRNITVNLTDKDGNNTTIAKDVLKGLDTWIDVPDGYQVYTDNGYTKIYDRYNADRDNNLVLYAKISEDVNNDMVDIHIGESFFFGRYEQDNKTENGEEPIEWIITDVVGSKALLVSKYVLDCRAYNAEKKDITWADSEIRKWLNEEFLTAAFSSEEQEAIIAVEIPNDPDSGNPEWQTNGGNTTIDEVFLLSYEEATFYYENSDQRKAQGTEYARANGAKFLGITAVVIGETDWWLRSSGREQHDSTLVDYMGGFNTKQVNDKIGVRPAICINLTADFNNMPHSMLRTAQQLTSEEKYGEATEIYKSLGKYANSVALLEESRYNHAQVLGKSGDYDAAIEILVDLGDYQNSYELCREYRYQKALSYQESGEIDKAIKLFTQVGQYKDSMSRLKKCFESKGISVFYLKGDAVNTGIDTGYSKSDIIGGNDNHFGWRLGRFFISDYTRVIDNTSDNPVFIKTLGNSITLWFDLEQDINALNDNTNLIIGEDQNGYDQAFGVKKTNFGRGTLIIQHIDYTNSKGDPQLYTDYLLAKGTTGANTRVELKEEGDYLVALDYELQDNDVTHIFNRYGNYSIRFKFSVRNGNCMVYPFDVVTKGELQNTSITENGFYLDLARSRYLDIDVKRTVLVDNGSGVVEDERFNRPAKDGDKYTQEGIYTISVKNRYTDESTTKTLFVGTQELLDQYKSMGFSVDRLK